MYSESVYDLYNQYFKVIRADTPELLEKVFSLRYQVLCVEHYYESPESFPNEMERDIYDSHAVNSLLVHRPTGAIAGSVRLILPLTEYPGSDLPIYEVCKEPELSDTSLFIREHVGELSRLVIAKTFRRRIGEQASPRGVTVESLRASETAVNIKHDRRVAHHLTLGLISALVQMSVEHGVFIWCSTLERSLLRLLKRIGIHFTNLGPQIEYYGKRQPCYASLDALLGRVRFERPDVWDVLTKKGEYKKGDGGNK